MISRFILSPSVRRGTVLRVGEKFSQDDAFRFGGPWATMVFMFPIGWGFWYSNYIP
jgi:hypothetical protein